MSTPEQGDSGQPGFPPETQLPLSQAPRPTETPTQWAPTPGVSTSAVKHPGAPTHPDPTAAFAGVLAQLANQLFKPAVPGVPTTSAAPIGPAVAFAPQTPQVAGPGTSLSPVGERAGVRGAVPEAPQQPEVPTTPVGGTAQPRHPATITPSFPGAHAVPGANAFSLPEASQSQQQPSTTSFAPADNAGYTQHTAPQPNEDSARDGFSDARDTSSRDSSFSPSPDGGAASHRSSSASSRPLTPALSPTGERELSASPFSAPLKFDGLHASPILPTLDGTPHSPADPGTPYWLQPVAPKQATTPAQHRGIFDAHAIRREFPILHQRVNGHPLVWLDNAATTQKPQYVIDRLKHFYENDNSNIHRAAHTLAARATDAYEQARETVRRFINAPSKNEIIFVRGTTEGINLVAQTWGRRNIEEGDEIVVSNLEHHANIVPWHRLCAEKKAVLKVAPVDDTGQIILEEYEKLFTPRTKLAAFSQVSNALGTVTPAREMIEIAHRHGAKVLLDGAQAVSHMSVDVQQLDCDFYVFSGHKVFAPTGIGAVFGKMPILEAMPPWQGGGNMIADVTFEKIQYQGPPAKFEAGTGNIADAVGLGAALDWLMRIGVDNVGRWEHELLEYATPRLLAVPGLTLYGTAPQKAGVLSFTLAGQKTEEVGGMLDKEGIAVRSGHHCAQPILRRFGLEASVRASLAPYNTLEDIDALCAALHRLQAGKPHSVR